MTLFKTTNWLPSAHNQFNGDPYQPTYFSALDLPPYLLLVDDIHHTSETTMNLNLKPEVIDRLLWLKHWREIIQARTALYYVVGMAKLNDCV